MLERILVDLAAIGVLVFGIYVPRHRRRDLVVAFLGVNVGVLAVASVLSTATIGVGLGLGLFGVLSIIRLRSIELAQHEIAYYFSALALGLLGGLSATSLGTTAGLMALVVTTLLVGDHPRLLSAYRRELVVLEHAYADETALRAALEQRLGARVHGFTVTRLDLVQDVTWVDVRYSVGSPAAGPAVTDAHAAPHAVVREPVAAPDEPGPSRAIA